MNDQLKPEQLRALVETTIIPHTAYKNAKKELDNCFSRALEGARPGLIIGIGESRTGKTSVLKDFLNQHVPGRDKTGAKVPVLYCCTPSEPTVKSFTESLLVAIGDPIHTGTKNNLSVRFKQYLAAAGTKMLLIDEFQHVIDRRTTNIAYHVADWLKLLTEEAKVSVVVAGLQDCARVIEENTQFKGRVKGRFTMPRFDWSDSNSRAQFKAILRAYSFRLSPHFSLVPLDSDDMAFRLFCSTGGLMGYLENLLSRAVEEAVEKNRFTIDLADLAAAHALAHWRSPGDLSCNPFDRNFLNQSEGALTMEALNIGLPALTHKKTKTK